MVLMAVTGFAVARAQSSQNVVLGVGVRIGAPVGDFSNTHSVGIGAELQAEYGFSEMLSGVFTTGYTNFFGKTVAGYKYNSVGIVPLLAGVRVYPSQNFFIGGQIGYGILAGNGYNSGAFSYQPGIGYNAPDFQIGLNYNALTKNGGTVAHIGLTGIYKFGGGK